MYDQLDNLNITIDKSVKSITRAACMYLSLAIEYGILLTAVVSTARSQSLFRHRMDVGSHCLMITNLLIKPLLSKKTFMRVNLSIIFSYIKSRNMINMCMLVIFIIFLCDCFRPCLSGIYALAGPLFPLSAARDGGVSWRVGSSLPAEPGFPPCPLSGRAARQRSLCP